MEEIPSGQVLWFDKSQCKHLHAFIYLIFDCADLSVYKKTSQCNNYYCAPDSELWTDFQV